MSRVRSGLIIVLFLLLCFVAAGPRPSHAYVIHENPADLTLQPPYDVNGKMMLQLELMFGSLDNVALRVNAGDFNASRLSMKDFDKYYQLFKNYLSHTSITGSDFQITEQADLTEARLRAIINSSEDYNDSMARFKAFWAQGDTRNATITADELQKPYDEMNQSSRQLRHISSVIKEMLRDTSVNTNHLDEGINTLNVYMDRMDELNELPLSLLGNTNLTLTASPDKVGTGNIVAFAARLSSNGSAVSNGSIDLYLDGTLTGNATTGGDGSCMIYHQITGRYYNRSINVFAYYDPRGASYTAAVSNNITLNRTPVSTALSMIVRPDTGSFGDILHAEGTFTTDDGYPVPDHLITVNFNGKPVRYAKTIDNGSFFCNIRIIPEMAAGQSVMNSSNEAAHRPGEALENTSSPDVPIRVIPDATLLTLDPPPSAISGGQNASFAGTLISGSGIPVSDEEIDIYADDVLVGTNLTDDSGHYNLSLQIPYNLTAGSHKVRAIYGPGDGMALAGSRSKGYDVEFLAAQPLITIFGVPLVAFPGDQLNITGKATSANGMPINDTLLNISMSGTALGENRTDARGSYSLSYRISGISGLQPISVRDSPGGLLEAYTLYSWPVLVMPFDMPTSLFIVLVIMAVVLLTMARFPQFRRRLDRLRSLIQRAQKKPLAEPARKVAPLPEPPGGPGVQPPGARFEDEIARINAIIKGGADRREVISEIYTVARRVVRSGGINMPESATHREFFKVLVAREPSLGMSAGTITKNYEAAVFAHISLTEKDIVNSLYSLKEISAGVSGESGGGNA